MSAANPEAGVRRPRWHLAVVALAVVGMLVVGRSIDVESYVGALQDWTAAMGGLAPVVYGLAYVGATLLGAPSMPFTLLAPMLFGVATGVVVMVAASTASAACGFLIARYLARDAVTARLGDSPGFARLCTLVEKHDWLLIPVLRTFPIVPFMVVNYGFGLTGIGFGRYFWWSAASLIPANVALVLGASILYGAAARGSVSWPVLGAAVAAGLVSAGLVIGARRARGSPARLGQLAAPASQSGEA